MSVEQLQIQIQANVQNALKGLNDLEKALKETQKGGEGLGNKGLPQVAKGANQANTAMINLGRTVSDAPFGFIGIANNIGPLVENFASLKKEAGTTGGALKQLGASLAGPGGVIVGIQLAVAAVQFAQLGFSRWGASAKKAKEDTDKLKQANDALIESVSKQRLEFETLVKIAKDASQSEIARTQALKKLNEILPDTIGNLTKQNIVTDQGTEIIKNYIKAVEAKATAELLSNRIAENNVKLFDNRNKVLKDSAKIDEEIRVLRTKLSRIDINATGRAGESAALRYLGIQNKINDLIQDQSELQAEGRKIAQQLIDDNNLIRKEYERQIPVVNNLNDKKDKSKNKEKTLQEKINDLLEDYNTTIKELNYEEQITGLNKSNERLNTNFDFLKRIAILGGQTSNAYAEIASKTQELADAASKFKIDELIKNYQTAITELDIKQAVTGQDQLNARINAATDALIKLKTLGVDPANEAFIKLVNDVKDLESKITLKEIRKRTEDITKTWEKFQLQIDKLNFNKTKEPLDALKSKIDLIGNAITDLKAKGLTDKDLGISILNIQFEQLGAQFEKLKGQKELFDQLQSTIEGGLTNAFTSVFEAIANGEDAFKALGDSVKRLALDLIRVVIQMTVVKALANALMPGLGGEGVDAARDLLKVRGDFLVKSLSRAFG